MASDPRITWLPPVPAAESASPPAAPPAAPPPAKRRGLGGLLLVAALSATKLKGLLLLLPKLKFFTTSASMLVSIAAYTLIFTWRFAVGFVLLLLVHELGHVIQLRREGVKASAPVFIPFLGAAIAAKSLGGNALAEARVGLAGPVLGTLAAAAVGVAGLATDSELLKALAFVGFFLNLFNLLPVLPLDGGRAMSALSPALWVLGFAGLVVLAFVAPNPVMLLILVFGGMETWRRLKQRRDPAHRAYYDVRPRDRALVFAAYVLIAVVCAVGMDWTFVERDLSDV